MRPAWSDTDGAAPRESALEMGSSVLSQKFGVYSGGRLAFL